MTDTALEQAGKAYLECLEVMLRRDRVLRYSRELDEARVATGKVITAPGEKK